MTSPPMAALSDSGGDDEHHGPGDAGRLRLVDERRAQRCTTARRPWAGVAASAPIVSRPSDGRCVLEVLPSS